MSTRPLAAVRRVLNSLQGVRISEDRRAQIHAIECHMLKPTAKKTLIIKFEEERQTVPSNMQPFVREERYGNQS